MKTTLLSSNDPVGAVRTLLADLMAKGVVDEVLAPAAQGSGAAALALFGDAEALEAALPFAPVMGVQGARMVSRLAFSDPGSRVAVLLRPCEARAVVELIKLQQIRPENLLFISQDCPGTFELAAFAKSGLDVSSEAARLAGELEKATAPANLNFRTACGVCENMAAEWGGIRLHAFGGNGAVVLEAEDAVADKLAAAGVCSFDGQTLSGRDSVVKGLKSSRSAARDALFAAFEKEAGDLSGMKKVFSTCIRCLNCMEQCPICYCKLCIFKSTTFDHPSERYPRWAARKGVQKMPSETLLFHLTRLNHMASSCIGCGLCDTACPMGLPVATLFRRAAGKVQKMLDYEAGRSLEDQIPLSRFREDELQVEAGAKD